MLLANKILRAFCHAPLSNDFKQLFQLLGRTKQSSLPVLDQMAKVFRPYVHSQYLTEDKKNRLKQQFDRYLNGRGRKEKIATIAWIIVKLDLSQHYRELLKQFASRIDDDQWYVNFEQSVRAMEAFHWIEDTQMRNSIYEKIERNVSKTIWEVNMVYYQRLSNALVKAGRLESPLWHRLEYHILNNLSMTYSLKTVLDTFHNFALANKGSKEFYYALQLTIYKGHLFETQYFLQGHIQHGFSSQLLATLFRVFALASSNLDMTITPQFSMYLLKILNHPQFTVYELSHITTIIENLKHFGYGNQIQREIQTLLFNKIKTIEGYINVKDVIDFYEKMGYLEILIPEQIIENITEVCLRSIVFGPRRLNESLLVYSYLIRNNLTGSSSFINDVQQWIGNQARYFNKQQIKLLISTMNELNKQIQFRHHTFTISNENKQEPILKDILI